jgi:CHAT domain-containing protein
LPKTTRILKKEGGLPPCSAPDMWKKAHHWDLQAFRALRQFAVKILLLATTWGSFLEDRGGVAVAAQQSSSAQALRQEEAYLRWQFQQFPVQSYETALVARRLGENLERQNRFEEASKWYEYSVNVASKLRDDRAKLLRFTTEIRLARLQRALGAFAQARSRYEGMLSTIQTEVGTLLKMDPKKWTSEHVPLMATFTVALTDAVDFCREIDQLYAGEKYLAVLTRVASQCTDAAQPRSIRLQFLPAGVISAYFQAEMERARGQSEKARQLFEEAKGIATQAKTELETAGQMELSKEVQALEIPILIGLGLTYYDLGQSKLLQPHAAYEKADACYTQAFERIERLPEEDRLQAKAQGRKNRGILYHEWAKLFSPPHPRLLSQAEEDLKFAADFYSKRARTNPYDLVHTYNSLGLLLLDLGKPKEALNLANQASATLEALATSMTSLELRRNNLMLLARSTWLLGEEAPELKNKAVDYAEQACGCVRQLSMRCVGDPFTRARARQRLWGRMEGTLVSWFIDLAAGGTRLSIPKVLKIFEESRGQSLLEEIRSAQAATEDTGTSQPELQTLQLEMAELAFRINQTADEDQREQLRKKLQALDRRYGELVREFWISRGEKSFIGAIVDSPSSPNWFSEGAAWIRENRLLVLWYLTDLEHTFLLVLPEANSSSSGTLWELKLTEKDAAALNKVVHKSGQSEISSGNLSITKLRQILSQRIGLLQILADKQSTPPIEALEALGRALLPQPILERISDRSSYDTLAIVADGPLGMLPFQALIVPHGPAEKFLVEVANPILYLPSLAVALARSTRARAIPSKVVSFGKAMFPEYHPEPRPLLSVIQECNQVAEQFRKSGLGVELRLDVWPADRSATKQELTRLSNGAHILHLATHGVSSQESGPWGSCLLLSVPERSPLREGLLTLADIYRLPLGSTELVLLSACRTQRGVELEGEGIWGVTRGFVVAGARQTLAAVWDVDSEVASNLMRRIAQSISEKVRSRGLSPEFSVKDILEIPKTLREAQLEIKGTGKEWEHPYFWAPFVVVGTP